MSARKAVIVPWLEGGGAQSALRGILEQLTSSELELIILFRGSRNHHEIQSLVSHVTDLNYSRTPVGAFLASRKLRKLLVGTETVYSLMRASHLVIGLSSLRLSGATTYIGSMHQMPSKDAAGPIGFIEDLIVKHATRQFLFVTAPSQRAVEELRKGGYVRDERAVFEGNVVTPSKRPLQYPAQPQEGPVRLLFAGRLTDQKGLADLPKMLTETVDPVHLRIVGDGPLGSRLERDARRIDKKHYIERIAHCVDITDHIDWADSIFLPSKWELNPQIVWEAWSRGRPVIGSAIDVLKDLAKLGPLYPFDSEDELATLVSRLAHSDDLREFNFEYGQRAVIAAQRASRIVRQLSN